MKRLIVQFGMNVSGLTASALIKVLGKISVEHSKTSHLILWYTVYLSE
jgi:hypothetical protein